MQQINQDPLSMSISDTDAMRVYALANIRLPAEPAASSPSRKERRRLAARARGKGRRVDTGRAEK